MSRPASYVLLVDPDAAHAKLVQAELAPQGVEIEIVATRGDALAALERRPPDLALIAADLPNGGGLELLREARRRFPDPAMALHSAESDVARVVEAMRAGALDYLLRARRGETHDGASEARFVTEPIGLRSANGERALPRGP